MAAFLADVAPAGTPRLHAILGLVARLGWRQRRLILPATIAAMVLAGLALVPPVLLADLIDRVFPSRDAAMVAAIGAAIVCIALADSACALARRLLSARAGLRLQRALLLPAFAALLRLTVDQELARDQGQLGRTLEEIEKLTQGATEGLIEFLTAAAMILVLATAMLVVDPWAGVAVLAVVAALAAVHVALAQRLRRREQAWFETRSSYWSHIVEAIAYAGTVRVNSAHGFAERRFIARLDGDLGAHYAVIRISAGLDAVGRFAGGLIVAAIALTGGRCVVEGGISIGDFVLVLSVGGSLAAPVLALVKCLDDVQAVTVAFARLNRLAAAPRERIARCAIPRATCRARLVLRGVHFAYGADAPVLRDVSCEFAPGERVAVVGPSGVGKSTLASLIFASRDSAKGTILLDDRPLAAIPLAELRRRIVVVPHEIDVFTGTVGENIALDEALADSEKIAEAAGIAGIAADIRKLPRGYDTLLGQGGVDLSAGQKQRLGIARAVLRRPDVLVLDESTSSLDAATEARVLDNVLLHLCDATVIAITHRPSVVARMDRAIDLGGGLG